MKKDYHATLRKVGSQGPLSVQFSAEDATDAIAELCAAAGVQNTNGLTEFEILEVLPGGEYIRAALKTESNQSTKERLAKHKAPVVKPEVALVEEVKPLTLAEKVYQPYIKIAA